MKYNPQLNDSHRHQELFHLSAPYLVENLHHHMVDQGSLANELFAFCIEVTAPLRKIVEELCPRKDWSPYKLLGLTPVAMGVCKWKEVEGSIESIPFLKEAKQTTVSSGCVRLIILSGTGQGSIGLMTAPKSPHED